MHSNPNTETTLELLRGQRRFLEERLNQCSASSSSGAGVPALPNNKLAQGYQAELSNVLQKIFDAELASTGMMPSTALAPSTHTQVGAMLQGGAPEQPARIYQHHGAPSTIPPPVAVNPVMPGVIHHATPHGFPPASVQPTLLPPAIPDIGAPLSTSAPPAPPPGLSGMPPPLPYIPLQQHLPLGPSSSTVPSALVPSGTMAPPPAVQSGMASSGEQQQLHGRRRSVSTSSSTQSSVDYNPRRFTTNDATTKFTAAPTGRRRRSREKRGSRSPPSHHQRRGKRSRSRHHQLARPSRSSNNEHDHPSHGHDHEDRRGRDVARRGGRRSPSRCRKDNQRGGISPRNDENSSSGCSIWRRGNPSDGLGGTLRPGDKVTGTVCSTHNKKRSLVSLTFVGGKYVCRQGYECGGSAAAGNAECKLHGKVRSMDVMAPYNGGYKCRPEHACKAPLSAGRRR